MKLEIDLKVFGDAAKISEAFKAEEFSRGRSEIKMEEKKDNMVFKIKSEDIPSMRAALNSLLKLFLIYEKMEEVE